MDAEADRLLSSILDDDLISFRLRLALPASIPSRIVFLSVSSFPLLSSLADIASGFAIENKKNALRITGRSEKQAKWDLQLYNIFRTHFHSKNHGLRFADIAIHLKLTFLQPFSKRQYMPTYLKKSPAFTQASLPGARNSTLKSVFCILYRDK